MSTTPLMEQTQDPFWTLGNGTFFHSQGGYPKLWEDDGTNLNKHTIYLALPATGTAKKIVYTSKDTPGALKTPASENVDGSTVVESDDGERRAISWKRFEDAKGQKKCYVHVSSEALPAKFSNRYEMYESDNTKKKKLMFGLGSPLPGGKHIAAKHGAYSSTNFGGGNQTGGLNLAFGGKNQTGGLNLAFGGGNQTGGLNIAFGANGKPIVGTVYGSAGYLTIDNENPSLNFDGSASSGLPPSLQARGQLYPMLKRIKLANAKIPGKDVWEFSTSGRNVIFLDSMSEKSVDASELLDDKPHTWYLLENPRDALADPYVLGVGGKTVRVHMPGAAIALTILKESDLFSTETLQKSLKIRAAQDATDVAKESTSNLSGLKLKRVIQELAFKVSYKTIRTMMRRVAPEGVDTTVKIKVRVQEEVREVRLVLYAVHKKHVQYLGMIGDGRITHLVAVWTESGELGAVYWASAGDTLDEAFRVVHEVATTMLKGEETPASLIEGMIDTAPPTTTFTHLQGEFGASVREASSHEYERHKKASRDTALGSISTSVVAMLADAASSGIQIANKGIEIAAHEGLEMLKSKAFGCSLDEPRGEEFELSAPFVKTGQPYTKLEAVYDQTPMSTCVLCSIGAAIHLVTGNSMQEVLERVSNVISPDSVPKSGLVMTDTFETLKPVFQMYGNLQWKRISPTVDNMKKALDAGQPVVVGTKFDGGIFNYPSNLDTPISGPAGNELMHCVTVVGYDNADSTFTVLNSWSSTWGRNGAMIVEQDYEGFDRAFVIFPEANVGAFGAVDIPANLPSIRVE